MAQSRWRDRAGRAVAVLLLAGLLPASAGAATVLSPGSTLAVEVAFDAQSCAGSTCLSRTDVFDRSFDFVVAPPGPDGKLTVNAASRVDGAESFGTLFIRSGVVLQRVALHAPDVTGTYLPIAEATLTRSVSCYLSFGSNCVAAFFDFNALLEREAFDLEAFRLSFEGSATGVTSFTFDVTVGQVPLPAAAWLVLGGLGMLGAASRRRTTRAG
jgi:hypothetical protein